MLQELITNTLLGGVTGYVTNNLAIKMLFKEYMGFGGVIEKEYESFIENISNLIEKDLINHNTLYSEIKSEKFQSTLKEVIKTVLVVELPKNSGEKTLNQLNGYTKTQENLFDYIDTIKPTIQTQTLDLIKKETLHKVVSYEQYEHISKKALNVLQHNENQFNEILYDFISTYKLEELISNKAIYKFKTNLTTIIQDIDFEEFDGDINKFFKELTNILDLNEIIFTIENSLNNMYLSDFINDTDNISKELIKRVLDVIKSDEGYKILTTLVENIIKITKEIDVSLFDILDDNMKKNLVSFIESKLPDILNDIIHLIDRNSTEIETRINNQIDEVLDRSFSGMIIKKFKNIFMSNLVNRYGVIKSIKQAILNYGDEAGVELSKKLLTFLKTKTIGETVSLLENKGLLKTDTIVSLIRNNLSTIKIQKVKFIDELLEKKVSDVIELDLSFFKTKIMPTTLEILKTNFIYEDKFKNKLKKEVTKLVDNLKNKKISDYLEKFEFNIEVDTDKYYKNIDTKLNFNLHVDVDYKEKLNSLGEIKLNKLYKKTQKEEIYKKVKNITIDGTQQHLKSLLSGNVSMSVSQELSKFQPSQIKDMVEGFMGKELKPINTLGSILGAVAGAGYYGATLPFANPYLNYATPLIYGITGVFTNHLAIHMLFRPYEKKAWLPYFSPGVVAKQKPQFAKNISNFVKGDILTDEALKGLFEKNKDNWEQFLKDFLSKDNYIVFENLLQEDHNVENITNISYILLIEFLTKNKEELSKILVEYFDKNKNELENYTLDIAKFLLDKLYDLDFTTFITKKLNEYELAQFIPTILKFISNNSFIIVDKLVEQLEFNKLKKTMLNFENEYKEFTSKHLLNDFLDKESKDAITINVSDKIITIIKDKQVVDLIVNKLQSENFNPNKKISQLFDGALENFLYTNINYLTSEMVKGAQKNKNQVKEELINSLPFGTAWALEDKVKDIVDDVFDKTLPTFIKDKQNKFTKIFTKILDYKISDLGINENALNKDKLTTVLSKIYESDKFYKNVNTLVDVSLNSILQMKVSTTLKLLNIRNLRQSIDILEPVLSDGLLKLESNITSNETELIESINDFLNTILEDVTRQKKLLSLVEGIDISNEINTFMKKLKSNDKLMEETLYFLEDMILEFLNSDFYNKSILKDDLANFIVNFLKKDELKETLNPFLKEFFLNTPKILDTKLKDELTNYLIQAIFSSLKLNLNDIVESVNIQDVIEREINKMHPQEIEKMFYSFAGSYFTKLKIYGVMGAVFGIPSVFV